VRPLAIGLILFVGRIASAQTAVSNWTRPLTNVAMPPPLNFNLSPNGSDAAFETAFWASGNTLSAWRTQTNVSGGSRSIGAGVTIRKLAVVRLTDGNFWAFMTASDGKLYKLNATTFAAASLTSVDTKRGLGCVPDDALAAAPTIQLAAFSSGLAQDLVIVPTFHGCGDHSLNQVIAYNASTLAEVWRFNTFGEYQVDYFSEGCSLDYQRNLVYCGANLEPGRNQKTLFAIRTVTAGAGQEAGTVAWAINANAIRNRPHLSYQRGQIAAQTLYVADHLGIVHAINPNNGGERWQIPITAPGTNVTQNLWAEFRPPYEGMLFVTDTAGDLHAIFDPWSGPAPEAGFEVWTLTHSGSNRIMSLGSVAPTLGKLYIGMFDGTVHQVTIASGGDEATYNVSLNAPTLGDTVLDPTLHLEAAADINKMVASAYAGSTGSQMKQFPVPFTASVGTLLDTCSPAMNPADPNLENPACTRPAWRSPSDCQPGMASNDCCSIGRCDPNGRCYAAPRTIPGGNTCIDAGTTCTINKRCRMGACVGTWSYTLCPAGPTRCPQRRACGPNGFCYRPSLAGGPWECASLNGSPASNNYSPCGTLGRTCDADASLVAGAAAWGGERTCTNGRCGRDTGICSVPTPASLGTVNDSLGNPASSWASGITFDRNGSQCRAYLPTYKAAGITNTPATAANIDYDADASCLICSAMDRASHVNRGGSLSATFTDPITVPGTKPVRINVVLVGNVQRSPASGGTAPTCVTGTVNIQMNGVQLNAAPVTVSGNCNLAASGTNCGANSAACSILVFFTRDLQAGFPQWNSGGTNTLTIQSPTITGAGLNLDTGIVSVTGNNGENYIRRVQAGATAATTWITEPAPGHQHGIAVFARQPGNQPADIYTTMVNRPSAVFAATENPQQLEWVALGHTIQTGMSTIEAFDGTVLNTPPLPTRCPIAGIATCPFRARDWNYGPTPPATDGARLFFGNYRVNGDLYMVASMLETEIGGPSPLPIPGCAAVHSGAAGATRCLISSDCPASSPTCVASVCTKACTSNAQCPVGQAVCSNGFCVQGTCTSNANCSGFANAPTCAGQDLTVVPAIPGSCSSCERVSAVAIPPARNTNPTLDDTVRVAVGSRIFFYDPPAVAGPQLVYWIDLKDPRPPMVGAGGAGSYAAEGMQFTEAITSISMDPLNRSRDLYVLARENRSGSGACGTGQYMQMIHVRGDDHAVRPLGDYTNLTCATLPGTLRELFPTGRIPASSNTDADGRISADSQRDLYQIIPVDPLTTPATSARATVRAFDLLP
jgi:hypothetical protein